MSQNYTVQKIINLFGGQPHRNTLLKADSLGQIPTPKRLSTGVVKRRIWTTEDLPYIGERYGFLKPFEKSIAISVFTPKGGVLKTTLALNVARLAALHNIKTCVVGLDLQGDISNALGLSDDVEEAENMEMAIARLNQTKGLYDFQQKTFSLSNILLSTDLPPLSYIPETPELIQLEQIISLRDRREYWLKEQVIDPLKKQFDLIIMDCSPNWNRLVTNALVASDVLISPLECKINNFRNCTTFRSFLEEFKNSLKLEFETIFVPTRFTSTRKLSAEIRNWYLSHIPGCTHGVIRESSHGEESMARKISLPEQAATSLAADEMRELMLEIWSRISSATKSVTRL